MNIRIIFLGIIAIFTLSSLANADSPINVSNQVSVTFSDLQYKQDIPADVELPYAKQGGI